MFSSLFGLTITNGHSRVLEENRMRHGSTSFLQERALQQQDGRESGGRMGRREDGPQTIAAVYTKHAGDKREEAEE